MQRKCSVHFHKASAYREMGKLTIYLFTVFFLLLWGILCLLNMDNVDIRRIQQMTKKQNQIKITGEVVLRTNQKTFFFFPFVRTPPTVGTNSGTGYSGFLEVSHKNSCSLAFKTKIMS